MKNKIMKDKFNNKLISLIVYIILIVLTSSLILGIINGDNKTFFGYTFRIVVTGSMEPVIKVNSISVIKACDIKDLEVGDIVCFNYSQDIVHRVIEKTTNEVGELIIHTQGDANDMPDSIEINSDMVVGKVVKTFNSVAPIIDRYSITPGQFDSMLFARNIILYGLLIGAVVLIASWIISLVVTTIKSFRQEDNLQSALDLYISDIDELLIYKEILMELRNVTESTIEEVKNSDTDKIKFKFNLKAIGNKIARAKAEIEIKNFHNEVKGFKRSIRNSLYLDRVCHLLQKEEQKEKEESITSISDVIKYANEFSNKDN